QRVDPGRRAAPPAVPGAAGRQGCPRGGAGDPPQRGAHVMSPRQAESVTISGIRVELSNPGKLLFDDPEITKGDLIGYYRDMAGRILPYLRDRPLVMARYPDGIHGQRIFQKNIPGYFPPWGSRGEVEKAGGGLGQLICDKPATLVYLANQACVELHAFLSRTGELERPDQLVFDLDPPGEDRFADTALLALRLRELLEDELKLTAYVKTTGGKGLHVQVPLRASEGFDAVRRFARQASEVLAARNPDLLTTQQRPAGRGDRGYAHAMRNAHPHTVGAPHSVR